METARDDASYFVIESFARARIRAANHAPSPTSKAPPAANNGHVRRADVVSAEQLASAVTVDFGPAVICRSSHTDQFLT